MRIENMGKDFQAGGGVAMIDDAFRITSTENQHLANASRWSADAHADYDDVTCLGDDTRQYLPGMSWTDYNFTVPGGAIDQFNVGREIRCIFQKRMQHAIISASRVDINAKRRTIDILALSSGGWYRQLWMKVDALASISNIGRKPFRVQRWNDGLSRKQRLAGWAKNRREPWQLRQGKDVVARCKTKADAEMLKTALSFGQEVLAEAQKPEGE